MIHKYITCVRLLFIFVFFYDVYMSILDFSICILKWEYKIISRLLLDFTEMFVKYIYLRQKFTIVYGFISYKILRNIKFKISIQLCVCFKSLITYRIK